MQMDLPPLTRGKILSRYKRFLADVTLPDGKIMTVHCPNPGSMMGLNRSGMNVWISNSKNPKRKLQYSLELVEAEKSLVGVNTNLANRLAREAIEAGLISQIGANATIKPEQKYGENSRVDFLVEESGKPPIYVEVKSVTLQRTNGLFEFPDSVTSRGRKHLNELSNEVSRGNRALMIFLVQRSDGDQFKIADDIDPKYDVAFRQALSSGVEACCIKCNISENAISPNEIVEIQL